MNIIEATSRNSLLIEQLLGVWESSVKATHLFLSESEIEEIKEYLAGNLCRCTGYMGQLRAIQKYMEVRNTAVNITVKKMGGEE